jgi:hypothetical protein
MRNVTIHQKADIASAGNRTRVNCLEGSYANHYTTDAFHLVGKLQKINPQMCNGEKWGGSCIGGKVSD